MNENDYILRGEAVDAVEYYTVDGVEAINNIPAADVVKVVRCKDCRFYYKDSDGYEMCDNSEGYDHISADGFCAWAERRADNG